jgi:Tol biopolymer transport system component
MDDLQRRFRRLDRVEAPYLWNEAVGRAAQLEPARRFTFSPSFGLIAAALLLAAMAGTVAVGALLDRNAPDPVNVNYDNGVLTLSNGCGRVIGVDPTTYQPRELGVSSGECRDFGGVDGRGAWSMDGRWLAYLVADDSAEANGVWLFDAESGEARHLAACRNTQCSDVDVSPDGSLVSYLTLEATSLPESENFVLDYGLVLVETASGAAHELDLPGLAGRPSFSPEGDRIALTLQGGQSGVHVIDVAEVMEGEFPERSLVHGIVEAANATWSPNGAWIAVELITYRELDWGRPSLWIVRPDRTEARQLTTTESDHGATGATWSPDSSTIAYVATVDEITGQGELRTISVDGGPDTRIADLECCPWGPHAPAWSPDGQWIAFAVYGDSTDDSGVMMVRADGSDLQRVSDVTLDPVWQPIPRD